ncbi:MAG: ABC transporter permease, partial [Rubrivivax sp.]
MTPASATGDAGAAPQLGKAITSVSPWRDAWRRFKRHRLAYWSLWLLGALVTAVLFGPLFYKV